MKDDIVRNIKACLKLAASSNPNEAETAWRQARALMDKHGFTEAGIASLDAGESRQRSLVKDKPSWYENFLAFKVSQQFSCALVFSVGPPGGRGEWKFIGVDVKPELASYAFEVLLRQLRRNRTDYSRTKLKRFKSKNKAKLLREFSEAWVYAAVGNLAGVEQSDTEKNAIKAYMDFNYPTLGIMKPRPNKEDVNLRGLADARNSGFEMGDKAQVHAGVKGKSNPPKQLEAL